MRVRTSERDRGQAAIMFMVIVVALAVALTAGLAELGTRARDRSRAQSAADAAALAGLDGGYAVGAAGRRHERLDPAVVVGRAADPRGDRGGAGRWPDCDGSRLQISLDGTQKHRVRTLHRVSTTEHDLDALDVDALDDELDDALDLDDVTDGRRSRSTSQPTRTSISTCRNPTRPSWIPSSTTGRRRPTATRRTIGSDDSTSS